MTNENTNTDEPTKAELHDRVQQLESTVEKLMPSRRDALKLGAAGIAGAAGLSATTQTADASTGSAGSIGSNSDRPDLIADDVGPRSIADDYLFAGEFSGSDPDSRLNSCLNAASSGETIQLESGDYTQNRTIATAGLRIVGSGRAFQEGTVLDANITLNASVISLSNVHQGGGTITVGSDHCRLDSIFLPEIQVNANDAILTRLTGGKVTFSSGTSGGIVDTSTAGISVTDNGANSVGVTT